MHNFKKITFGIFVLHLLLIFQSVSNSEQMSQPVTYLAEFAPLGDGIDWEKYIPDDFDPVKLHFEFFVNPGTLEAEINGNVIFDPGNGTLSVQPNQVVDEHGNKYVGKLKSAFGVDIDGKILINIDIPFLFTLNHSINILDLPGIPKQLRFLEDLKNKNWDEETFFDSLLLGGQSIQLDAGIRNIFSSKNKNSSSENGSGDDAGLLEITLVEVIANAATAGVVNFLGKPGEKILDIAKSLLGDAGIKFNLGFNNRLTLSGEGISLDGSLTTNERQSVAACGSNLTAHSYPFSTSYVENFTQAIDLVVSSDIFFKAAIWDGKFVFWDYKRSLATVEIPIVGEGAPFDNLDWDLDFKTSPDLIEFTFPVVKHKEHELLARGLPQQNLPEGAKARLGKGFIREITYSPDGNLLAVASSIGTWLYDGSTGKTLALLTGHTGDVLCVRFSPDGKTLATGGIDATVRLWDVATGASKAILRGDPYKVLSLSFSPDGETIATAGSNVYFWDVTTGKLKATLAKGELYVLSLSFSPDGETIATGSSDGTRLWDVNTGRLLWDAHTGPVVLHAPSFASESLAFSPDGKILAISDYYGAILFDVDTRTYKSRLNLNGFDLVFTESLAFSPDGKTLATGGVRGLYLWDVATGTHKSKLPHSYVKSVAFSPDSTMLASASYTDGVLWDVNTKTEKTTLLGHSHDNFLSVSFSPDSEIVAISSDHSVQLWDVNTGTQKATLKTLKYADYGSGRPLNNPALKDPSVLDVSFSPDSKTIATDHRYYETHLWDAHIGTRKSTFTTRYGDLSVAFSSDGTTLATGDETGRVVLLIPTATETQCLLTSTLSEKAILREHADPVTTVAFSPDGKTLVSVSRNGTVQLWDVNTETQKATLQHTDAVSNIAFSPDSATLASSSAEEVQLWDVNTETQKATLQHTDAVSNIAFSPDSATLASSSAEEVQLWDVNTETQKVTLQHTDAVSSIEFSPDGATLVSLTGVNPGDFYSYDFQHFPHSGTTGKIHLWDVETGTRKYMPYQHGYVTSVRFSPDGKTFATASVDGTVLLWDSEHITGILKATLTEHRDDVNSVSFSPDGKTIASAVDDNTVRVWDINTWTEKATLIGHTSDILSVSFSPDGKTIATGSADHTVRMWDVNTWRERTTLTGHKDDVNSVAFSPDGKTIATGGSDKTVRVWNADTGTRKGTLPHKAEVNSVSFSPDGKTLATGSEDHTIRLWDVNTWREKTTLIGQRVSFSPDGKTLATASNNSETVQVWDVNTWTKKAIYTGHKWGVNSISFSPDSTTLATGGADSVGRGPYRSVNSGTVRVWDIKTITEKARFTGHTDTVNSVSFSPDGTTLASGSADGTVRLWRIMPTAAIVGDTLQAVEDLNGDGEVNIQDLVAVDAALEAAENDGDVNGDGEANIQDLVVVAAAIGEAPAAPSTIRHQAVGQLTSSDVQQWLIQAQHLNLKNLTTQRGILFLQYLLALLTSREMALLQNYPNPFNPETWIPYQLAKPAEVRLTIYDINGRAVRTLDLGHQHEGTYHSRSRAAYWDGKNAVGEPVASGAYFYTLTAGDFTATRKMLILK